MQLHRMRAPRGELIHLASLLHMGGVERDAAKLPYQTTDDDQRDAYPDCSSHSQSEPGGQVDSDAEADGQQEDDQWLVEQVIPTTCDGNQSGIASSELCWESLPPNQRNLPQVDADNNDPHETAANYATDDTFQERHKILP